MPTVTAAKQKQNHEESKKMVEAFMAQNGQERFLLKMREVLEKHGGDGGPGAYSDKYILNMVENCPYYLSIMLEVDSNC